MDENILYDHTNINYLQEMGFGDLLIGGAVGLGAYELLKHHHQHRYGYGGNYGYGYPYEYQYPQYYGYGYPSYGGYYY
ncbi:unnamed protein product [Didymodactylos carnosus]|uniref:Uncharacterized protein n=1 Tax=Didymodactylos carnosus TaxID=1234261 RepID=A0A813NPR5_9BILA|nr:unnamed protein product [Didymodactylos carnosus]CAF1314713.1 unnamed protein product [Didymodactylos carnosus]CAF3518980.1 unnamed protein product [Didymodactylos carnosus]CAF4123487.1 unnamed protein product [Didymodactylos carnosus]